MRKKIYAVIALCMALEIGITGCGTSAPKEKVTSSTESTGNEELDKALENTKDYSALDYVTLGDYKGVEVSTYVSDEDVESKIGQETAAASTYEEIKVGTVKEGDNISINFVGKMNGQEFDGGSADDYVLEIGSHSFIDGFEEGLVGVKVGDTVDLNLKFPDPYDNNPDFAGKDVVFTVTVNYIQGERKTVEFDDEFAKNNSNGECNTTEEYREKVRNDLYNDKVSGIADTAFMTVLSNSEVKECPQFLVDLMKLRLDASYKSIASKYKYDDFEKFVQDYFETTIDEYNKSLDERATQYVKQQLVTEAIAEKENIAVSDEEYQETLKEYMDGNGVSNEEEMEKYSIDNFASKLDTIINEAVILNKVLKVVKDNAVEVKDKPLATATPTPSDNQE